MMHQADAVFTWLQQFFLALVQALGSVFEDTLFRPVFLLAVALILLLERWYPVDPKQGTFSVGFAHDSVWMVLGLLFEGLVVAAYAKALRAFYEAHLSFLTVEAARRLPELVRIFLGILLADLLAWFQHWLKHKVPWFWQFHAVHHSQREINLFTDFRFHFMEYIISRPIVLIPMMMLTVETPTIVVFSLLATWQTRFYHANIKSNLGLLRYIFVTPQSHRVHHSIERRHQDRNFGVMFSFWDRLFGTQTTSGDEYPETGIRDAAFPLEKQRNVLSLLMVPARQLVYPFVAIGRSLRRG